jgi:uncharacterized cupin superfamily protein
MNDARAATRTVAQQGRVVKTLVHGKWSGCIKPITQTDSCQAEHTGYCLSGRMHVVMTDGSEMDIGPNDAFYSPPGHDAWIVGNEACVALDFTGAAAYARK